MFIELKEKYKPELSIAGPFPKGLILEVTKETDDHFYTREFGPIRIPKSICTVLPAGVAKNRRRSFWQKRENDRKISRKD